MSLSDQFCKDKICIHYAKLRVAKRNERRLMRQHGEIAALRASNAAMQTAISAANALAFACGCLKCNAIIEALSIAREALAK